MSEFDKWWEENCMILSSDRTEAEDIYNLGVESQQAKIDEIQNKLDYHIEANSDLAKLSLELQKKYDAMYNAFIVADDCRKDWHESYIGVRKERDELVCRIGEGLKIAEDLMGEMQNYKLGESLENILKGNKDEN